MTTRLTGNEGGPNDLDPSEVQGVAITLAQLMYGMVDVLVLCHAGLGMASHADPPSEGDALREELRGDIEILVNEALPTATKILARMAGETDESLLVRWRQVLALRIRHDLGSGDRDETKSS